MSQSFLTYFIIIFTHQIFFCYISFLTTYHVYFKEEFLQNNINHVK